MRSRTLLAAAFVLFAAIGSAAAEDIAFTVRIASPTGIETGTRQTFTVSLIVTNGPVGRTLVVAPGLPAGWRTVAGGDAFVLEPDAEDLRLVAILVPSGAPAGPYRLPITVREARDPDVSATVDLPVTVLAEPGLSLHLIDKPPFVVAGASYTATFMLVNDGNTVVHPTLTALENLNLPVDLPPTMNALEPGGQLAISVNVRTDPHIRSSAVHRLTLSAKDLPVESDASDAAVAPPLAQLPYSVEIVPLSVAGSVPMHTLRLNSLTASRIGYSGDLDASLKESLSLAGTLDEAGKHHLEADIVKRLASGVDPLFAPEDRYSLAWRHRLGSASIGDTMYELSPLLADDQDGRGMQAAFTPRGMSFGAMYYSDPWSGTSQEWLGARAGASFPLDRPVDQSYYRVDAAARWPLADTVAFDLRQRVRLIPGIELQLDTALQAGGAGGLAPAILAEASAAFDGISGNFRFLRAWPEFDAAWHDTQAISADAASVLLDGNLRLSGSFSLEDANLLRDPGLPNADRTVTGSLHAGGTVPQWRSQPKVYLRLMSQRDLLPIPDYDWFNTLLQLSWGQKLSNADINALSMLERNIDHLDGLSSTTLTEEITVGWRLSTELGMSTSLHYDGRLMDDGTDGHTIGWKIGARGTWATTDAEGGARTAWTFTDAGFSRFLVGLSVSGSHVFSWGHSIRGSADVSLARDLVQWQPGFSLNLSYGATTNVPLYQKRDSAVVRGRVSHQTTGEPRSGVLLRLNGLATITDENGEYVFNIPKSGTYYLQVDRGTLGKDLTPSRTTPIKVDAPPRSKTVIDIEVVERASLAGTVSVWGFDEHGAFDRAGATEADAAERINLGGLGNLVIELTDGEERIRRLTNRDGRFEFAEVRPGTYTLEVIGGLLPAYHHVEHDTYAVVLAPGQVGTIEVRVLQESRRIQMVEVATLDVIETPSGRPGEFSVPEKIPVPVEPAPVEPAPVEPAPVEPEPVDVAAQSTPIEPTPVEPPAPPPFEPAPVESAPVAPELAPVAPAPATPTQLAPQLPPLSWEDEYAATLLQPTALPLPTTPAELPAPAVPVVPTAPPLAAVPVAPAPVTTPAVAPTAPAPAAPPATAPVTKPPAAPVPVPPAPAPTPTLPLITIPIPLPMPTPRPPVTLPVPTPTPTPFPP